MLINNIIFCQGVRSPPCLRADWRMNVTSMAIPTRKRLIFSYYFWEKQHFMRQFIDQKHIYWVSLESTNRAEHVSIVSTVCNPYSRSNGNRIRKNTNFRRNLENRTKKSNVSSIINPAAKNGFDIWNRREKLHLDHSRARWKLKIGAIWNILLYIHGWSTRGASVGRHQMMADRKTSTANDLR